jgi:predicted nuclease of predicted toxin-antitoxin system
LNRFIADENIPSHVIRRLRDAGHDVVTVAEAASAGIRNYELAELSARVGRILLTRDADFTTLRQSVRRRVKVIYIRGTSDPHQLADLISSTLGHCLKLLEEHNVVVLDEDGCHTAL